MLCVLNVMSRFSHEVNVELMFGLNQITMYLADSIFGHGSNK